jgi:hypothetical protein
MSKEARARKGSCGRATSYRACPIKRDRRSKADIDGVKKSILDVIREDPPMTVRQVFYQLVTRGDMRLSGELRWDWVVDESRRRRITQTFDSITDAVEHTAKYYRRSALRECSDYLEIWCEKDALAGALWDVTSDYDVPLLVSKGMPSLTLLYGSAVAIARAARWRKEAYIYQFGDHDPSGVLIPQTNRAPAR